MEDKEVCLVTSGPIFHDPNFFSVSGLWILQVTLWHRDHSITKDWPGNGGTLNNSE